MRRRAEPKAVVAAGQRVQIPSLAEAFRRPSWQDDAWAAYHAIGELKYAARFQSDILRRAKYFGAHVWVDGQDPVPVEDTDLPRPVINAITEEMARIPDLNDLIARLVVHWQVPGEAYLLVRPDETWDVVGVNQLSRERGRLVRRLHPTDKTMREEIPEDAVLLRIWQQDEQWPDLADSPMRSLLSEAEELLIFERHLRAVGRSRIANSSLLVIASDIDPVEAAEGELTKFERQIYDALTSPIANEGSAAAVAPILVKVPADRVQTGIRFVEMPRPAEPILDARIDKIVLRMARAWNLPPERIMGMAGTTFANASQIERSEWDAHLAPLAEAIALGITKAWLRPALLARNIAPEIVRRIVIGVDPARAVTNPTISTDAKDAHKALAISDQALRRALGFDEGDAPSEEELNRRIATVRGMVDPVLTQEMLRSILDGMVEITTERVRRPADDQQTRDERRERPSRNQTRSGQDRVPREPAAIQRVSEMVQAAAPFATARAVEVVGARLKAACQGTAFAARVKGQKPAAVVELAHELVAVGIDVAGSYSGVGTDFAEHVVKWCRSVGLQSPPVATIARRFEQALLSGTDPAEAVMEVISNVEAQATA